MAVFAVIDNETNQLVNSIIADHLIESLEGTRLVEIPEGFYWDGSAVVPIPIGVDDGN